MWYNTQLAATKLKTSRRTIYNLIKKGYLTTRKDKESTLVWIPSNAILDRDKKGFKLSWTFK